ncbi:MAG: transglycosylase domain-containing protein, partial [Victivallales bacterium]|nr:transglycosylase domain-containing protein [Victivallales bacterium]
MKRQIDLKGFLKKHRALLGRVGFIVWVLVLVPFFLTRVVIYAFDDEVEVLRETQPPSVRFYDSEGRLIKYRRASDFGWRVPVKLEEVSPHFIDALLAIEDRDFYKHGPVSYKSIARAAMGNIAHGKILSGASTITMQLAYLSKCGRRKNYIQKIEQIFKAYLLERKYTKNEILEEYVNRINFGDCYYGIEAASLFYFDKHASELTIEEAAVLAGIPQRPNKQNPKSDIDAAKRRQLMVLQAMEKYGFLERGEAAFYYWRPLPLRDYTQASIFMRHSTLKYDMYLYDADFAGSNEQGGTDRHTYLNTDYHREIERVLNEDLDKLNRPSLDAAAVLIDSRTNRLLALVGTQDYNNDYDGWVNGAMSTRDAGSTMKPFIYAKAMEAGRVTEGTILKDAPVRFADYSPGNFNGKYYGNVSVAEALSLSLNTPVVRLLSELGVYNTYCYLAEFGLVDSYDLKPGGWLENYYGLSMALGTTGTTLYQLSCAYNALANGGVYTAPIRNMEQGSTAFSRKRLCTKGTACMISSILRRRQLPGCVLDVAWKTGTSNGYRDAWCIAYTPDFTLGVWFGDKYSNDGYRELVGAKLAAPAAGRIFSALYATHEPPLWPVKAELLDKVSLCKHTGLLPGPHCKETVQGYVQKEFV